MSSNGSMFTRLIEQFVDQSLPHNNQPDNQQPQNLTRRLCGIWIALRLLHLNLSNADVLKRTGLDEWVWRSLICGIGTDDGEDGQWRRLCSLLSQDQGDAEFVTAIVAGARGQSPLPQHIAAHLLGSNPNYVLFADTTLRDGIKAQGIELAPSQKLIIARDLVLLGVDVVEVGTFGTSSNDAEAVQAIARAISLTAQETGQAEPIVTVLAIAENQAIDAAYVALQPASRRRIHTYLPVSNELMVEASLTREVVLTQTRAAVRHARSRCKDVQFTAMDAVRAEPHYLYSVLTAAIEAGASTLNLPDTVGYATPDEYSALIAGVRAHVLGIEQVVISAHCHNDMGMAVGNTLAAIKVGARQVECTINGIGERAGNAALEEVAAALHIRQDIFQVVTAIRTTKLARVCGRVSAMTKIPIPRHKPVVGSYVLSTEQEGASWEQQAKSVPVVNLLSKLLGYSGTVPLLTSHSSTRELLVRVEKLGYELSMEQLEHFFVQFQELAERNQIVQDREILALLGVAADHSKGPYQLLDLEAHSGGKYPNARVTLLGPEGETCTETAYGSGPIDAVYEAIKKCIRSSILESNVELAEFTVEAVTENFRALAQVRVRIAMRSVPVTNDTEKQFYDGHGLNTDTTVAAARAFVNAINKLLTVQFLERNPQLSGMPERTAPPTTSASIAYRNPNN